MISQGNMVKQVIKVDRSRLGGLRRVELHGNPGTPEGRSKGGKKTIQLFRNDPELARSRGFAVRKEICYPKGNNGADIIVSSSNLVDFLLTQGIVMGNKIKNQVGVPLWIQEKIEYRVACLRGLMDTDGGVYFHNYRSGGKDYRYLKLAFTNCSKPLLDFVLDTLPLLKINAYLSGYHVSVYSKLGVKKYFEEVGSHNPKHIGRFREHFGEVPEWPIGAAC